MLAAILASACTSTPPYDDLWPARVMLEGNACPAIDGTYLVEGDVRHSGRGDSPQGASANLINVLNGEHTLFGSTPGQRFGFDANQSGSRYRTVTLRREGRKLHVTGTKANGAARSFFMDVPDTCSDSLLHVDSASLFDPSLAAYRRASLSLGQAADGSLLVLYRTSGVAFVVVAASDASWMLFLRVADATSPEIERNH
jgi:hypothetical protein